MRDAEGRILCLSQRQAHRLEGKGVGLRAAGRCGRCHYRWTRFWHFGRRLYPRELCELDGEHPECARSHARVSGKSQSRVGLSCSRYRALEPRCAFARPIIGWPVELGDCRNAVRNDHPRLLGGRVDVNVGRSTRRIVECPGTYEMNAWASLRIVAPHGHATGRAAPDDLALAAGAREGGLSELALVEVDLRRIDKSSHAKDDPLSRWHHVQWQEC